MKSTKKEPALIYNDQEYSKAVNYSGALYNSPITLNINSVKYILGAGTSDHISVIINDNLIYIITENSGLDYLGAEQIDIDKQILYELCFIESNDINDESSPFYKITDLSSKKQLQIINEYF